jgi:uncharacterized protein (TIGR02588 family)
MTQRKVQPTPLAEWIAAGIGLAVVLATLATLLAAAVVDDDPPDLAVEATAIAEASAGYRVELVAENRGGAPAAEVVIEGTLRRGDQVLETRELTLSYLPGHSSRSGGMFFVRDPRGLKLELRPVGYESP